MAWGYLPSLMMMKKRKRNKNFFFSEKILLNFYDPYEIIKKIKNVRCDGYGWCSRLATPTMKILIRNLPYRQWHPHPLKPRPIGPNPF